MTLLANRMDPPHRRGGPICTATGRVFWPLDPRPDEVSLEDIAAALSRLCRFGGHCRVFYSIAQHSVHVAALVHARAPHAALWGLMHDAAEAYLLDIPGPVKHSPTMAPYREAEAALKVVIAAAFRLPEQIPDEVRWADRVMFATETRDLMTACRPEFWAPDEAPRVEAITAWPPERAEAEFLAAYCRLSQFQPGG